MSLDFRSRISNLKCSFRDLGRRIPIFRWPLSAFLCLTSTFCFQPSTFAADPILPGYTDYIALTAQVRALATKDLVTVKSLGTTLGKRDVWLVTIGTGNVDKKPALLVMGNVHAPHLLGSELALRFARQLTEKAKTDDATKKLLEQFTFYVIPRPTPDPSEAFFTKPYLERAGNERPTDDDHDGKFNADPPDDLNGDGFITLMRIEDSTGDQILHPADPRIMVPADPKENEKGTHAVYREGRHDDGDGLHKKDGPGGVDFNRNFTFKYPFFKIGAGPNQVSEVETRAVADFCFDHPNIALVFTFTPEDNLLHPWKPGQETGRIRTTLAGGDQPYTDFLAERYRKLHGGKDAPGSPAGEGSFSEWAYYHYGRWSLAARAWWIPKVAEKPAEKADDAKAEKKDGEKPTADKPATDKIAPDGRAGDELNALRWFAQEKIDGFVDWKVVENPDFPNKKCEVGGIKPFYTLNPPAKEIDALADKHFQYLTGLCDLLPKLALHEPKVEPLGGGLFRVSVTVVNNGYLPTMSEMGQINHEPFPLQIRLEVPATVTFVNGKSRVEVPRLTGNGGKATQTWIVRSLDDKPATAKIRVHALSVGSAEAAIELKP